MRVSGETRDQRHREKLSQLCVRGTSRWNHGMEERSAIHFHQRKQPAQRIAGTVASEYGAPALIRAGLWEPRDRIMRARKVVCLYQQRALHFRET